MQDAGRLEPPTSGEDPPTGATRDGTDGNDGTEGNDGFRVDEREVIHETLEGESVLVHMGTGVYFSLRGAAAEIWPLVVAGYSKSAIVRTIVARYAAAPPDVVDREVRVLLESLLEHQLATRGPAADSSEVAAELCASSGRAFETPRLEAFEDMQELLLLDPIHETGEEGWPQRSS